MGVAVVTAGGTVTAVVAPGHRVSSMSPMAHVSDLMEIVVRAASSDSVGAIAYGTSMLEEPGIGRAFEARVVALLAFAEYLDAHYARAVVLAERAVALAQADGGDNEAWLYAAAMRLLASAGTPWAGADGDRDHFAIAWALRGLLDGLEPSSRLIAGHLLAEAVLSTGHLGEAQIVLDRLDAAGLARPAAEERRHGSLPFMHLQYARVAYFQGRMNDALPIVEAVIAEANSAGDELWASLAHCYLAVIAANRGDRERTRATVDAVIARFPHPAGYLGAGIYAISGYALAAIGDLDRAAALVARGGGDDDLSRMQVGDRAFGFEVLVAAALGRGDLPAAEACGRRSFAIAAHPAATPIIERLHAQLDLARGAPVEGAERASVSAARARLNARYLDAARSTLLWARALAAAGLVDSAITALTDVAHDAGREGLSSVRFQAAAELRRLGRRLGPVPGSGWAGLGERERQIAVLAADGFSNRVIGRSLFLSQRTVQTYMSRVLSALGAPSRTSLPALVGEHRLDRPREDAAPLTSRQREVAELIAAGASNRGIADALGISPKTVEKHTGEILVRWEVSSRTAIASIVVAQQGRGSRGGRVAP